MRALTILLGLSLTSVAALAPTAASAQDLTASERGQALASVRAFADCLERQHAEMSRIQRLIGESEAQRDRASGRVRQDAEAALEALIARAAAARRQTQECVRAADIPSPGTRVVERAPPPDPAADSVAQQGGTVRTVEENAALTSNIRVVRGEQVDGQGQLDASVVRSAVRGISSRLERCYDQYLERGSLQAQQLNLVFTVRGAGRASRVSVERSGFSDARFERCVRSAGGQLRVSRGASGGEAIYSYTLRFGREARR
ncbi:MAG: hypothetical protein RLO52_35400 [Sandaracinaceae bacterium]